MFSIHMLHLSASGLKGRKVDSKGLYTSMHINFGFLNEDFLKLAKVRVQWIGIIEKKWMIFEVRGIDKAGKQRCIRL